MQHNFHPIPPTRLRLGRNDSSQAVYGGHQAFPQPWSCQNLDAPTRPQTKSSPDSLERWRGNKSGVPATYFLHSLSYKRLRRLSPSLLGVQTSSLTPREDSLPGMLYVPILSWWLGENQPLACIRIPTRVLGVRVGIPRGILRARIQVELYRVFSRNV